MTSGKITIKSNIDEQKLMESCLNQTASGYDMRFALALHAMANEWKADKLIYYMEMLEEEK